MRSDESHAWFFHRFGLFELWVALQFIILTGVNLPTEAYMYEDLCFDVYAQVFLALGLFFLLTLRFGCLTACLGS